MEYRGETLFHQSTPRAVVEHVVGFMGEHGIDFFLEANSGMYRSLRSRNRIAAAVYGEEADPAVVADLSVGFGQFIERFVVTEKLVRNDINKMSLLGSPMPDARPEVLSVSNMITPSAGEDGLARGFSVLGLLEPGRTGHWKIRRRIRCPPEDARAHGQRQRNGHHQHENGLHG